MLMLSTNQPRSEITESVPMRKRRRNDWPARLARLRRVPVYPRLDPTNADRPASGLPAPVTIEPAYFRPASIKGPASTHVDPLSALYSTTPPSQNAPGDVSNRYE